MAGVDSIPTDTGGRDTSGVPVEDLPGIEERPDDDPSATVFDRGVMHRVDLTIEAVAWAVVHVNGARVGFYVLLEPIDDKFVQRWFGEDEGVLYGTTAAMYAQGLNPFTTTRLLDWYDVAFGAGDGSDIEATADAIALGTDEELEVELGGYSPVFGNMVVMDMERPWEYSHWRPNSVTGEPYTEPLYERKLAEGWDLAGWMETVASGPLDWAAIDARVQEYAAFIAEEACSDSYHTCSAHLQRVANLRFFLHSRLSRLAEDAVPFSVTVEEGELTLLADELRGSSCDRSVWVDLVVE